MKTQITRISTESAALLRVAATAAGSLVVLALLIAATVVTPGKKTSGYPHTNQVPDSALILWAITNISVPTNMNQTALEHWQQGSNGLASISFVTGTSNATVTVINQIIVTTSNALAVANLWTNSGGIVRLTTNGPVSIASTGLVGGLVVTQDMRILGHNLATNYIWVCTNGATGEGEWRDISTLLSPVGINPRTNLFNVQYEPVRGSTWYSGTNGIPTTNEARAGLEFNPFWRSLRMGQVDGGPHVNNMMGDGSNAWNNTNLGVCSVALGSNAHAKADYSSVLGGKWNGIRTNAKFSVIGGGNDNQIDTNASSSVIAGGGKNWIRTDSAGAPPYEANATISGGSNNVISGASIKYSVIAGGGDNLAQGSGYASIGGGQGNQVFDDGLYGTIAGGSQNRIGTSGGAASVSVASTVSGGTLNAYRGAYGFIGGGRENGVFGNAGGANGDYNVICGGASNNIGILNFPSKFCFVGSGHECDIQDSADYSVMGGGRNNSIGANFTNSVIAGGANNVMGGNKKFAVIGGGERNTVTGNYGVIPGGASNSVTADYATAMGNNVTNGTAGSVMASEFVYFNTPAVIAGAGTGSTNYTLQLTSPEMVLGSSNVNIVAAMGWIDGKRHRCSVSITNLSGDNWGFSFSSVSNRVKWQSWMYGTNAPSVLTNNTLLRIDFTWTGTNGLAEFKYFSPAG